MRPYVHQQHRSLLPMWNLVKLFLVVSFNFLTYPVVCRGMVISEILQRFCRHVVIFDIVIAPFLNSTVLYAVFSCKQWDTDGFLIAHRHSTYYSHMSSQCEFQNFHKGGY